jgi:4-hydroxy-tetrahydrodipicolinate synthase
MTTSTRPLSAFICAITPLTENDTIDEDAIRQLFSRFIDAGVGAFVGTASPGEGQALSLAETETLYGVAVDTLKGKTTVRAMGCEPRTAKQFLELVKIAEKVGMDGMQLYSLDLGHGQKPTDAELELFFRRLLDNMSIPAIISSHIMSGGYLVPVDVFARLLDDYPHLVGINVTSPDLSYLGRIIEVAKGRADVHAGGPMLALNTLAMGGQGFLCSEGILTPKLVGQVIKAWEAGDLEGASKAYDDLMRLFAVNVWPGGSVRYTKAAMKVLGLPGWHIREPFLPLDDAAHARIRDSLKALALPELEQLPWS